MANEEHLEVLEKGVLNGSRTSVATPRNQLRQYSPNYRPDDYRTYRSLCTVPGTSSAWYSSPQSMLGDQCPSSSEKYPQKGS
jgi:hypothetical protein